MLLRRGDEPVAQHDGLHFRRVRRAFGQKRRNLTEIAGPEHARRQDAEAARRPLQIIAEGVNDPALDEDRLSGLERDVLAVDPRADWYSIAQHNLGVLPVGSSKRHLIRYAFQVCNGAGEERDFVVSARQAPLEGIEAFLPGMPGGRAILDSPGKAERLGIVASADPSAAELERAPAELTVKIARRSCRRFTLVGALPEGNALINVTQSRDERVVGGLSVLAMAEEKR